MNQIYLISYENAQWCGGGLYCLVYAASEEDAEMIASQHMEEAQLELYADHYEDEPLEDGDMAVGMVTVELLHESEHRVYAVDPSQASFYPKVNY